MHTREQAVIYMKQLFLGGLAIWVLKVHSTACTEWSLAGARAHKTIFQI